MQDDGFNTRGLNERASKRGSRAFESYRRARRLDATTEAPAPRSSSMAWSSAAETHVQFSTRARPDAIAILYAHTGEDGLVREIAGRL